MRNFIRGACFALTCALLLFASTCLAALAPNPVPVGANDGEWTYLGRFFSTGNYATLFEWETRMTPYNGNAETDNLYDAYYYHSHEGTGDGHGCVRVRDGNGNISHYGFSCVLKLVPLNRNGSPKKISGKADGVLLLSMRGGIRGVFGSQIERVRIFDSVTHSQLVDITNTARDKNPGINGKFYDSSNSAIISVRNNSPFYKAMHMTSGCPIKPWNLP